MKITTKGGYFRIMCVGTGTARLDHMLQCTKRIMHLVTDEVSGLFVRSGSEGGRDVRSV